MKKILFATTALVATAGIASADVALTGSAEMGIIGGDFDGDAIETQFHTDIDVTFTMSGEADNGLTFGASIDLDESDGSGSAVGAGSFTCETRTAGVDLNGGGIIGIGDDYSLCDEGTITFDFDAVGASGAFGNTTQDGETIFISAGGATLTMGDTDGAFDAAMREVNYAAGSINDDETEHAGFNGNATFDGTFDGQIARFDYAFSGVTASLSVEMDDTGTFDPVWGLGIRYEGDLNGVALGVGVGYQSVEDVHAMGLSVDAGFSNGLTVGFNYSDWDLDGTDVQHGAIGVGYEMNALAIGVNYGHFTSDGDEISSGFGLAAAYDLGGGLAAQFGYGASTIAAPGDDINVNTWSLGLAMSF
ncbi:porin [Primorskyibacter aestuariivivens]|uniref:porin n=1 Tax=Primorskyibacter aestuariivivens TaxID=1888912 RepID=UPI0023010BE9|nr:porin [Primorskyibacter aestuariivivens]MDA7428342.1 porin [Primorskyibacter aestuariivivens]